MYSKLLTKISISQSKILKIFINRLVVYELCFHITANLNLCKNKVVPVYIIIIVLLGELIKFINRVTVKICKKLIHK